MNEANKKAHGDNQPKKIGCETMWRGGKNVLDTVFVQIATSKRVFFFIASVMLRRERDRGMNI